MNLRPTLFTLFTLLTLSTLSSPAQDYRNDMFGTRSAGYEPRVSQRGDMITQVDPRLQPFYHGVASGDPTPNQVIIWTRVTPENGDQSIPVWWKVATDPQLQNIVTSGSATATAEDDFCVKVDVSGLQPGTGHGVLLRLFGLQPQLAYRAHQDSPLR